MILETSRCSWMEKTYLEQVCEFLVTQRGWEVTYNAESFFEIRKGEICLNVNYANVDGSTSIMLMNLKSKFKSPLELVLGYLLELNNFPHWPIEPLLEAVIKHIDKIENFAGNGVYLDKRIEDYQSLPSPWW
jgi:hypothetical protein